MSKLAAGERQRIRATNADPSPGKKKEGFQAILFDR
jgi:hypothetical protein